MKKRELEKLINKTKRPYLKINRVLKVYFFAPKNNFN